MSLLITSPYIVDIYGHCGTSVLVQFILGRNIDELLLKEERENNTNIVLLTSREKLNMALKMARALSELHGYKDGVIVHDDVQYCQYLLGKDDRVYLSDFNRAGPLLYDVVHEKYC